MLVVEEEVVEVLVVEEDVLVEGAVVVVPQREAQAESQLPLTHVYVLGPMSSNPVA